MDKEISIEELGTEIDFDQINFSISEYMDRHPEAKETPEQIVLSFEKWDNLVKFLRKYFEHFGIDVSSLDDSQLMVVIKTIYRMSDACAYREGFKDAKKTAPSFYDQLVDFFNGMAEEMEDDPCITWTDFIPKDCKKLCSTYNMHIDAF